LSNNVSHAPGAEDADGPPARTRTSRIGRKGFDPAVRDTVIAAARRAMETKGIDGVKARFIANEAGISVGSVYNLFGDLDGLIRIVNGQTYDELLALERSALEAARTEGASATGQMLALAAAYLDFVKNHQARWLATLAFNRAQNAPPPTWYLRKEQALLGVIEDAIGGFSGLHNEETRHLCARALWASVHGIVTMAVADGFLIRPVEDVWDQIRIIVEAVAKSFNGD